MIERESGCIRFCSSLAIFSSALVAESMLVEYIDKQKTLLGRLGLIAAAFLVAISLAVKSFSWLHSSPFHQEEYEVIAEWQIPAGGKGMMIAIGPHYSREELRALGSLLRKRFSSVDNAAVMIFNDADAARDARRGYRIVGAKDFQAALLHQRAMYLKSRPRGEDSLTIYDRYPTVGEVIRFGEDDFRGAIG